MKIWEFCAPEMGEQNAPFWDADEYLQMGFIIPKLITSFWPNNFGFL
jgi:hypothetical protein